MKLLEKVLDMCCSDGSLGGKLADKFGKKQEKTGAAVPSTDDEEADVVDDAPKSKKNPRTKKDGLCNKDVKFDDLVFAKLPIHVEKAVKILGFTKDTWDNDGWTECEDKHWRDLTADQKEAAETLGWSEEAWDHKYEHSYWKDLPEVVKKAAASVGFDEAMWDSDEWPEELKHKSWADLSKDERRAMNVFGYHKNAWD